MTYILRTKGGRTAFVHSDDLARSERIAGLDPDGRIVVDDFDARNSEPEVRGPYADGRSYVHRPFMFGLTLCCQASDKGVEDGIVCRGCYSYEETGNYLYKEDDGSFPGLDPIADLYKAADVSIPSTQS